MSLPSLRTETMSDELAKKIGRIRKTGFTLAPEAATERMRAVINKGNREQDLLRAVESIFQNGWSVLKLYFMIGLPEERDEDVVAIAELARRCLSTARRAMPKGQGSAAIHLGASTFVPKPFTPFQWEPMIPPEETRRRQGLITAALGGRNGAIQFKPHDSRQSSIEGALALGDRRVAPRCSRPTGAGSGWTAGPSGSTRAAGSRPSRSASGSTGWGSSGSRTAAAGWTRSCPGTASTAASARRTCRSSSPPRGTWPRCPTACSRPARSATPATTTW